MFDHLARALVHWFVTNFLSSQRCVIAELFCEGSPLFDLSQLLAYKSGDYSPEVKLSKIDANVKVIFYSIV